MATAQQVTPSTLRQKIFPDRFVELDVDDTESFADLAQMAPGVVAGILGQPNVLDLNIAKIHATPALLKDPTELPSSVLGLHASSVIRSVGAVPAVTSVTSSASAGPIRSGRSSSRYPGTMPIPEESI